MDKSIGQERSVSLFWLTVYMSQTFGTMAAFLAIVTLFWDSTSRSEIINKTANIIYKSCNHFI